MLILLIVLLSNQVSLFADQGWYSTSVPRGRHVNALKFLSPYKILYAGGNEFNESIRSLWMSYDRGTEWETSGNTNGPWLKSMSFIDTLRGFAVGDSASIIKTIDGAHFWSTLPKPIQNREFNKIIYVTPSILFIVGGSIPLTDTMQTIVKSTDGGNSWSVKLDRKGFWLNGVSFIDSLKGVAVGDNGTILRTIDGGTTWSTITAPIARDFNMIKFINSTVGYIVGGSKLPDSKRTILRTNNGGVSWSILKDETGGILKDITFSSSANGYIAGDSSTVLKTINAGLNWTNEIIPGASNNQLFNCVEFKNDNLGMIGANDGYVHVYADSYLAEAYTLNVKYFNLDTFILFGAINSNGEVANYNFFYSLDSSFSNYGAAYIHPPNINTHIPAIVESYINGLLPDTTYYYYFQSHTLKGNTNGDTLKFSTKKPDYIFQTLTASNIASSSSKLIGNIDKFPASVTVSFEYGTSLNFGSEIAAIPSVINDTLSHFAFADVSNLDSNQIYFFRLKGKSGNKLYYGNLESFYTGTVFKKLQTLAVSNNLDSIVTLNGYIDKFKVPVEVSFEYGQNPFFDQEAFANPSYVNDTLPHYIGAFLSNLIPNELYYYRIKAKTSVSTFYGDILTFRSGLSYGILNTADATNITTTSAQLNAIARNVARPITVSFEYGTTPSLGNTIAATPSSITDTTNYQITANLSGLQQNQVYYFRLKTVAGGLTIYGDTKQFYTGSSEIPNWDFQFWQTDTVLLPTYWNVITDSIAQVQGHNSLHAIKLYGNTLVTNGYIGDGLFGGVPLNVVNRPDSIIAYMNYALQAGDSGGIMVILKKQGVILSTSIVGVEGSSGGDFKRISSPLHYDIIDTPDSVLIVMMPSKDIFNGNTIIPHGYIIVDDISFLPGNIPFIGSDFENWFPAIIENPVDWHTLKYIGLDTLDPNKNHMVSKAFFNNIPNDFAVEIKNIYWYPIGLLGGNVSTFEGLFSDEFHGFPVRGKHITLNGYYKSYPVAGDTMQISVIMLKNTAEVGRGYFQIADTVDEFRPFSIPISYFDESVIPDSAIISLQSSILSYPKAGSRLIIDKLSFDGFLSTGINTQTEQVEFDGIKIYPNPTRDNLIIEIKNTILSDYHLSVMDIKGQVVKDIIINGRTKYIQLEVGNLNPGTYFLVLENNKNIFNKKFIIVR